MQKRIMIVEDSEEMQFLYMAMFRREADFLLVAQEYSAEGVIDKIPETKPDLMIIDITLGLGSGLDLAKEIHLKHPYVKILIITGHEPERYMEEAADVGAENVISKGAGTRAIKNEIRRILSKGTS